MKTPNHFFDKAHIMIVYLVMSLINFIIFFCMIHFVAHDLGHSWVATLKFSLVTSALMGFVYTYLIWMSRKNGKFWDDAKILEDKIEQASTQKELENLYDNDLKKLHNNAFGAPQYSELKKFKAIILTKAKYVK